MHYSTQKLILLFGVYLIFYPVNSTVTPPEDIVIELTDKNWDRIQKGQWMIGFFDTETKESKQLESDWTVLAIKCREQNINVGKVLATQNPGLDVRFLVTTFPGVFYIKNGVAHPIPKANRASLIDTIRKKEFNKLKPVSFLSNPFSVQMSLLSHLFIHAVNLYNYEDAIVQKIVPFTSATDIAFGLTFIVIGTSLGLLIVCFVGIIQYLFFDSKDTEDIPEDNRQDSDDEKDGDEHVVKKSEDSDSIRKRKRN